MDNYKTWLSNPPSNNCHYQKEGLDKWVPEGKEVLSKDSHSNTSFNNKKTEFNLGYDIYINAGGNGAHRLNSCQGWAYKGSRYPSEAPCKWATPGYYEWC